jgi:hypothetical protein
MANKLTILGWGGWFVVTGVQQWFSRGVNEVSVVYIFAPFVLFFLYFVHVKIPMKYTNNKKRNDYEIGGFISLNCVAFALYWHQL